MGKRQVKLRSSVIPVAGGCKGCRPRPPFAVAYDTDGKCTRAAYALAAYGALGISIRVLAAATQPERADRH